LDGKYKTTLFFGVKLLKCPFEKKNQFKKCPPKTTSFLIEKKKKKKEKEEEEERWTHRRSGGADFLAWWVASRRGHQRGEAK
jgi:hypothetical protein